MVEMYREFKKWFMNNPRYTFADKAVTLNLFANERKVFKEFEDEYVKNKQEE